MKVAWKTEDLGSFASQLHRKNDIETVLNDYE